LEFDVAAFETVGKKSAKRESYFFGWIIAGRAGARKRE
jgi:hypothetical protein